MKAPKQYGIAGFRWKPPDKEWLEHHYWRLDKSMSQIARELGCTVPTVRRWIVNAEVRRRNKHECALRHSKRMSGAGNPAWNGGTSRNYHANVVASRPQICEWCRTGDGLEVHHRDHDTTNGAPDNLGLLCHECNMLEASLWMLERCGRAIVGVHEDERTINIRFTS